jgi:HK97 family phage major capsid protein
MSTITEFVQKATAAIAAGNLEEAEGFTKQAKALKALEDLQPAPAVESAELTELRAMKAGLDAEPATKAAGHLIVTEDETDKQAARPWKSLGEQMLAVRAATMFPHRMDERLKAQKAILGASEGVPSDGGFLVQQDFAAEIFRIAHDTGAILQRTRRIPIGPNANGIKINAVDETSRATGSRWGGVQAYWAAEGDSATATKPKFRRINWELKSLEVLMYITDEQLEDAGMTAEIARQSAAEELSFMVNDAVLNGDGVGKPLGILNSNPLISATRIDASKILNADLLKRGVKP